MGKSDQNDARSESRRSASKVSTTLKRLAQLIARRAAADTALSSEDVPTPPSRESTGVTDSGGKKQDGRK